MSRTYFLSTRTYIAAIILAMTFGFISFGLVAPVASAQTSSSSMLAELQLQITLLMAQIAAMQGNTPPTAPADELRGFTVGSPVQTTSNLRVRSAAGIYGVTLGAQRPNQQGTVVAGPTVAGGYTWYKIDFATGVDGWVAGNWLLLATAPTVDVSSFVRTVSGANLEMEPGLEDASIIKVSVASSPADRYANKVVLQFTPGDNEITEPWVAFEEISLWVSGFKVGEINASDFSAWRKVGNSYEITAFSGNQKLAAGREYNLTVALTSDEDTPVGDRWTVTSPKDGVVIWSKANGHMTNASALTTYQLAFIGDRTEASEAAIEAFTVTPATVKSAQPVKFNWQTEKVTDCSLFETTSGAPVAIKTNVGVQGSYTYTPQWKDTGLNSATYMLRCQDASTQKDSVVEASVQVTLAGTIPKPVPPALKPTCEVTTDKSAYKFGEMIKISWTTKNAGYAAFKKDTSGKDNLVLPGDKLATAGSQSVKASVIGNPVITMMAFASTSKDVSSECLVKINIAQIIPHPVPPSTPAKGTYVGYLNGEVFITTKDISEADALANCKLNAKDNPTDAIRCTWNGKEIFKSIPVTTNVPNDPVKATLLPTCDSFTSSRMTMTKGETATLTWATTNATAVTIDNKVGAVAADGKAYVKPTVNTTYTLKAIAANDKAVSCTRTIKVTEATTIPVAPVSGTVKGVSTVNQLEEIQLTLATIKTILSELE